MKYTFKVTKEILKESVKKLTNGDTSSRSCAIACAVQKQFPDARMGNIWLHVDHRDIAVSKSVSDYVAMFDTAEMEDRLNLPEFEFTLNL